MYHIHIKQFLVNSGIFDLPCDVKLRNLFFAYVQKCMQWRKWRKIALSISVQCKASIS